MMVTLFTVMKACLMEGFFLRLLKTSSNLSYSIVNKYYYNTHQASITRIVYKLVRENT